MEKLTKEEQELEIALSNIDWGLSKLKLNRTKHIQLTNDLQLIKTTLKELKDGAKS